MDILDKLNHYATGYRDGDDYTTETVFAEAAAAVIEELRAIRDLLEPADAWSAATRDTARARSESLVGALTDEGGRSDGRGRDPGGR